MRKLKGPGRPINPLDRRLRVLAGLGTVDWVVSFSEDTPEDLLRELQPDVLVKGGDYTLDEVVGGELVKSWEGDVRGAGLHRRLLDFRDRRENAPRRATNRQPIEEV